MSATDFSCVICLEDKHEVPVSIDNSPTCRSCVISEIIPKFHAAIKHEANYPVEWSGSVQLDIKDFAKFFDDYPSVLKDWNLKVAEYRTKKRIYCPKCEVFIGPKKCEKQTTPDPVRWMCVNCSLYICMHCAAPEEKRSTNHTCQAPAEHNNPFGDLVLGKDYQICPSEACKAPLFLQDGCNSVDCTACRVSFCYICAQMNPGPTHWNRGGCPRFNQPGATNALYNESIVEANFPNLQDWQTRRALLLAARRAMFPAWIAIPQIATLENDTNIHRLQREASMAPLLHATHIGRVMRETLDFLQRVQRVAFAFRQEVVQQRHAAPLWLEALLNGLLLLTINLDIYIFRVRIEVSLGDYRRRHEAIRTWWTGDLGFLAGTGFGVLQDIVTDYFEVAEHRFGEIEGVEAQFE